MLGNPPGPSLARAHELLIYTCKTEHGPQVTAVGHDHMPHPAGLCLILLVCPPAGSSVWTLAGSQ